MKSDVSIDKNTNTYNRIAKIYGGKDYKDSALSVTADEIRNLKHDGNILDLGCGPGNNFSFLLNLQPKKLFAVDLSENMLKEAKTRYKSRKNITYVLSSFQDFESNDKFDLIIANLSFVHLPKNELPSVLKKMKTMLNNDGIFFANYFAGDDESKELTDNWGSEKEIKRDFCFYTEDTLKRIYREAGLDIYKVTKTQGHTFERINIFVKGN
jgi:cyclopropane fatty-acyl-phospholipid synthase-like methyltransferase